MPLQLPICTLPLWGSMEFLLAARLALRNKCCVFKPFMKLLGSHMLLGPTCACFHFRAQRLQGEVEYMLGLPYTFKMDLILKSPLCGRAREHGRTKDFSKGSEAKWWSAEGRSKQAAGTRPHGRLATAQARSSKVLLPSQNS